MINLNYTDHSTYSSKKPFLFLISLQRKKIICICINARFNTNTTVRAVYCQVLVASKQFHDIVFYDTYGAHIYFFRIECLEIFTLRNKNYDNQLKVYFR